MTEKMGRAEILRRKKQDRGGRGKGHTQRG